MTSHCAAGTASRKLGDSRAETLLSTGSPFIWPTIHFSCRSIGLDPNVAVAVGVTAGAAGVLGEGVVDAAVEPEVVEGSGSGEPPEQAESVRASATASAR